MAAAVTTALRRLRRRAADADGFGMVELVIAMTILTVAIAALVTSFAASAVSLRRASQKGTATALADTRMEWYRRLSFQGVRIDGTLIPASTSYATANTTDSTIPPATNQAVAGQNDDDACPSGDAEPDACFPSRTVTGPDRRTYRVDTYVNYVNDDATLSIRTPAPDLLLKRVTVVVRDGTTDAILARESSAFHGP